MIKRILCAVLVIAFSVSANAQRTCYSTEATQKLRANDAVYDNEMKMGENGLRKWVATGQQDPGFSARAIRTIPVVVHVIYNTNAQNVSDAAIQQMIAQMNLDYTKTNTDLNSARAAVRPLAADAQIQFCLAQRDPNGASTTGIERLSTTKTCWDPNTETDKMKSTTTGGLNPWNRNNYLNFWIVALCGNTQFSGTGGYAYVASTSGLPSAAIDGVVIDYYWGMSSGHVWSHEVGHYLGLHHTWGDLGSNACGNVFPDTDDGFSDTPDSKQANFSCTPVTSCTANSSYGDLLEDFMDYSSCPVLFTTQQANYMNSVLSGPRSSLTSSNVCSSTGAPIANFTGTPTTICAGQTVTFTNTSTGTGNTYAWTFAGGTPASSTAANPTVTYNTAGTYTVTLVATNTNGNNTKTQTNYITVAASAANALPLTEGFESTTFPPTGWSLNNVDASTTWARTTSASGFGTSSASAYVNNFNYNAAGQKDWLITPSYNFGSVANGRIKWDYAYASYNQAGYEDSLEVLYSTNCGATWTSLWKRGGTQLNTATATASNFVPTAAQWKKDSVSLSALNGQTNVRFAFKNACAYGNNIFLDNVNIYSATAQGGSAPVANFIGTPTTVVVGSSVAFTDLSTNTPNSWSWSFPGGATTTSTAQNPTITYNTVGTYNVTLTASNGNGNNSVTKANYITVIAAGGGSTTCDTLSNIYAFPADSLRLYGAGNWGFLAGHNGFGDLGKAEYFENTGAAQVTGGLFYFAYAKTSNPATSKITARVWDGTGGTPGTVLASQDVLISTIATNVAGNTLTPITFATPANVTGNFFIGFNMTYVAGDTVGLVTTGVNNAPLPNYGWEQQSGGAWYSYSDATNSWGADLDNVILPFICITTGGAAPTASFTANNTAVCVGSTVNFTSTSTGSPTSYSWSFTGGTPTGSSAQNPSVVYNTAGTYTVALTASNGNGSNTSTQTNYITVYAKPTLSTSSVAVACYGASTGSATVTATGGTPGYTYTWSGGGSTATISNKPSATYTVTVSDTRSCSATTSVNISQPLSALAATGSSTDAVCGQPNGSVTASASGGAGNYSYNWNTSANTQTVSNLSPATYTVTITDANSCTVTTSATVSNGASNFAVTTSVTNASCSQNNGSAAALPNNPTGVTYVWSNNSTAGSISNLAAGTYTVTVTNPAGCTASASATITNVASNISVTFTTTQAACGQTNGGATAAVTGGTAPYSYNWSTGSTTNSIANVAAGAYPLTVTDNTGCSVLNSATISNSGAPTVTTTPTSPSCFGGTNGSALATVTGGTQPYSYTWSSGGTSASVTGLGAGTYTVSVQDNAQCVAVKSVTITNPAPINLSITTTNALCGNQNGSAVAVVAGGGTYTYFWSNGNTTVNASDLAAGSYSVTVTSTSSCTATATAQVGSSAAPTSVMNTINGTCQITPQISLTILGGTQPFTYAWSNGASTQNLTGITAGSYTVTITDANGCKNINTTSVTDNSSVNVTFNSQNPTSGNSNGSITANPTGGTTPYTYNWNTGSTSATVTGLAAGTYTVTITDQTGCVRVASVTLSSATGVAEVTDIAFIKVYPNPAHDVCNIQLELNKAQNIEIKMFNSLGQQVWMKNNSDFKQGTETVDVSKFAVGVYMIQLQVNGSLQTVRFVKSN